MIYASRDRLIEIRIGCWLPTPYGNRTVPRTVREREKDDIRPSRVRLFREFSAAGRSRSHRDFRGPKSFVTKSTSITREIREGKNSEGNG